MESIDSRCDFLASFDNEGVFVCIFEIHCPRYIVHLILNLRELLLKFDILQFLRVHLLKVAKRMGFQVGLLVVQGQTAT